MLIHPLATLIATLGVVQKHDFQLVWFDATNFRMTNFLEFQKGNGVIEWGNFSNRFECDFELINQNCETGICRDLWNLEFNLKSKAVNKVDNSLIIEQNLEKLLDLNGRCEPLKNNALLEIDHKKSNLKNPKLNSKLSSELNFQPNLTTVFKNKEAFNYHFSPLNSGFERTGYTRELANFFNSIRENIPTKSEILEILEIYRVLEEISQKVIF